MSYFTDTENDFAIYDAPKTGGTTVRLWICYAGTGDLMKTDRKVDYYSDNRETYELLKDWGYSLLDGFGEPEVSSKVCIKRDPVKRFISCYRDKILGEQRANVSVDDLLDHYDEVIAKTPQFMWDNKTNYIKFHFDPQTFHYGSDVSFFEHVFDISEMNTGVKSYLESKWDIEIPKLHARDNRKAIAPLELTEEQIAKVKKFYQVDYDNGWF